MTSTQSSEQVLWISCPGRASAQKHRQRKMKNVLINVIQHESSICRFWFMSLGQAGARSRRAVAESYRSPGSPPRWEPWLSEGSVLSCWLATGRKLPRRLGQQPAEITAGTSRVFVSVRCVYLCLQSERQKRRRRETRSSCRNVPRFGVRFSRALA